MLYLFGRSGIQWFPGDICSKDYQPLFLLGLHMANLGVVVFLKTVPSVMVLLPIMSLMFLFLRPS